MTSITPSAPERNFRTATPGVLGLDASRLRGRLGHHALDGTDEPLHQVDVVRRLVHDRAAVELPRPAPRLGVVVLLRARPAHRRVRQSRSGRSVPCRWRACSSWIGGLSRFCLTTNRCTPAASHVCTSSSAAASEIAIGFSVSTCFPALRGDDAVLRMQPGRRADRDEVASAPAASISSSEPKRARPAARRPPARARRSMSRPPTSSSPSIFAIASKWLRLMRPQPDERDAHGPGDGQRLPAAARRPSSRTLLPVAATRSYVDPQAAHVPCPLSGSRSPHWHIHPMRRAGTPTISA